MADFVSQSDFDFSVRVSTHAMTVKAGQQISIPVMVEGIKGKPRPVTLSASDWRSAGLSAEIVPSTLPSGRVAALNVTIPPGTAPGSYLFTVRGATEGTFKTSNDTVTVVVEPDEDEKENQGDRQDQIGADAQGKAIVSAPSAMAKRASLFRSAKKAPARPPSAGQRALFVAIMFVMVGVLIYYLGAQIRTGSTGSATGIGGTYVGTSTFCINSVMGNDPECDTSNCSIQIDGSGNVLGPVLFGRINGTSFSGEADAGNGSTFPMTGTFSNGTLTARYASSSVSWTITVQK